MKKIFAGIAVSILSVVITLGIIEIGFRLISRGKKANWQDRPKEYFIHEDSPTFQDYPYAAVKDKNIFRIAVIGDSFTFAPHMQFDDAFPKRMERYLNLNRSETKVEVINYGVPAYSTSHEVPIVKKAIKEGADLILMQITFNDPEIKPYTPTQLYNERNKFGELKLEGELFLYWKSLGFVLTRIHNTKTHENYIKKFFDLFEKPKTWNNFKSSWEKIDAISSEAKVPTVAVVFPLFGLPLNSEYPFQPIHQKVKSLLDELQIPSLDLYHLFAGIPLDRIQVIVGEDFHPNEIAHRLAAERILSWFRELKLVPEVFLPKIALSQRIGIKLPGKSAPQSNFAKETEGLTDEGD